MCVCVFGGGGAVCVYVSACVCVCVRGFERVRLFGRVCACVNVRMCV